MIERPELMDEIAVLPGFARTSSTLLTTADATPCPVEFDLVEELETLIHNLGPRAHAAGRELVCRVAPDLPARLIGDSGRLRQALTVVLEHAVRFAERGEVLIVVASAVSDGPISPFAENWPPVEAVPVAQAGTPPLMFSVRGISRNPLGPIRRDLDESTTQLLESLGGLPTVRDESEECRVWSFQLALEPAVGARHVERAVPSRMIGSSVLVVDDNASTRNVLEELLTGWGARVRVAESGEAALATIRQAHANGRSFDALLLDARMPRMSGFAVAEHLMKNPGLCGPVLLLVPSPYRKGDEAYIKRLGVARISKPLRRAELIPALVTALAGRKEPTAAAPRVPSSLMPEAAASGL
jgi:CheY-like chemotaxis protein